MGENFHTPWTTSTIFKTTSLPPALASLDKGITYLKNVIVHTDGAITYNKTTGVLTWASTLRVLFVREDGQAIKNTVAAGDITLADNEFAYIDLNETNDTVLTVSKAAVTTGSASNFKAVNRLVLAYRNTASDELFPVYLSPYWLNIPVEIAKGGTGLSALGTANQIPGVNAGTTALEYKTIVGETDEINIAHSANEVKIGIINPLKITKGGTGLSGVGTANQVLGTNNAADAFEHKTIQGTTDEIEVTHAAGSITLGNPSKAYASVQTTDATVTTLISKTLTEGKAYIIIAKVVSKQADTNRASYVRRACVYRPAAGSATLQGSVQDELTVESNVNWDCTIDVNTNDVRVRVTGDAATTIDWKGSLEFIEV